MFFPHNPCGRLLCCGATRRNTRILIPPGYAGRPPAACFTKTLEPWVKLTRSNVTTPVRRVSHPFADALGSGGPAIVLNGRPALTVCTMLKRVYKRSSRAARMDDLSGKRWFPPTMSIISHRLCNPGDGCDTPLRPFNTRQRFASCTLGIPRGPTASCLWCFCTGRG